MKPLVFAIALCIVGALGCSLFTPQNAKFALDATELACVFSSELTDSQAVADACAIDKALVPLLDKLIAQRQAAKKSGVAWDADASIR